MHERLLRTAQPYLHNKHCSDRVIIKRYPYALAWPFLHSSARFWENIILCNQIHITLKGNNVKKNRKAALAMLAALCLMLPVASYAQPAEYAGEWVCVSVDMGDGVLLKEYEGVAVRELMRLTLDQNGGMMVNSMGQVIPATWTVQDQGITALIEGQQVVFVLEDGKLVNKDNGVTIYLEKQSAAPKTGGLLSLLAGRKYEGRWISTAVDEGDGVLSTEMDGMLVDGLITLDISGDGTILFSYKGQWEEIEGGIRFNAGDEAIDFMLVNGQLALEADESMVYFSRDTQATSSAQAPIETPVQAQTGARLAGLWQAMSYEMESYTFDIRMLFPDGLVMELREDGTAEAKLTPDYTEKFTWSGESGKLYFSGSYVLITPVYNEVSGELRVNYGSDAATILFMRAEEGKPALSAAATASAQPSQSEPTQEPVAAVTDAPAPTPLPEDTPKSEGSEGQQVTKLFTLRLKGDNWTENTSWRSDRDDYVSVRYEMADEGGAMVAALNLSASVEEVRSYRDKLKALKGYAAREGRDSLDEVFIGGFPFLGTSYENWGWTYTEYAARAVSEGVTMTITIEQPQKIGDGLQAILDSIAYSLPQTSPPNVDPPLPEDGERYIPSPHAVPLGEKTLTAGWLKTDQSILLDSIFSNSILRTDKRLFALVGGTLHAYAMENGALSPAPEYPGGMLQLTDKFEYLAAGKEGILYASQGMFNILAIRDGAVIKDNPVSGDLVTHPSGDWGLTFWANADPMHVTPDAEGGLSEKPWVLSGLSDPATRRGRFSMISCVAISDDRIYVAGTDVLEEGSQRVAAYSLDGEELFTFGSADWAKDDAFGSVTGIIQTKDSILVMDGNYRAFKLFDLQGSFLGMADCDDLLGTDYPWLTSIVPYDGGAIVAASQSRADESGDELLLFSIKGF